MLPVANGNPPHLHCIYSIHTSTIVSQPNTTIIQSPLGNGEALASTDARSDHAVLDLPRLPTTAGWLPFLSMLCATMFEWYDHAIKFEHIRYLF